MPLLPCIIQISSMAPVKKRCSGKKHSTTAQVGSHGLVKKRLLHKQSVHVGAAGISRRRLRGKQAPPPVCQASVATASASAASLAAEVVADDELAALASTARRTHVHWTHVHTKDPSHVQPESMTREELWNHLATVYAEVYPDAGNPIGSILLFGLVASEQHRHSSQDGHRHPHKHVATFSSKQHYWSRVAKVSLEKYKIPLSAVVHDSYATMYAYLRRPTAKKTIGRARPRAIHVCSAPEGGGPGEVA